MAKNDFFFSCCLAVILKAAVALLANQVISRPPASCSGRPMRWVLRTLPSVPLTTLWEMINISRLRVMPPLQQLCRISIMLGGMLRADAVCSLTQQLLWQEWETCPESWMAERSHVCSARRLWPTWSEMHNGGDEEEERDDGVESVGGGGWIRIACRPTMQHVNWYQIPAGSGYRAIWSHFPSACWAVLSLCRILLVLIWWW